MERKRREPDPPHWKRVDVVMKVQAGVMSVAEAARELGISSKHYYRLEETVLRAALGAATPGKRGPRVVRQDPQVVALQDQLTRITREREILEIQVKDLQEVNEEMKARALGIGEEKKRKSKARSSRAPVSPGVPPNGSGHGNPIRAEGENGGSAL